MYHLRQIHHQLTHHCHNILSQQYLQIWSAIKLMSSYNLIDNYSALLCLNTLYALNYARVFCKFTIMEQKKKKNQNHHLSPFSTNFFNCRTRNQIKEEYVHCNVKYIIYQNVVCCNLQFVCGMWYSIISTLKWTGMHVSCCIYF